MTNKRDTPSALCVYEVEGQPCGKKESSSTHKVHSRWFDHFFRLVKPPKVQKLCAVCRKMHDPDLVYSHRETSAFCDSCGGADAFLEPCCDHFHFMCADCKALTPQHPCASPS
jgi:hypothetical protein